MKQCTVKSTATQGNDQSFRAVLWGLGIAEPVGHANGNVLII